MQAFDSLRELRNADKYDIAINTDMTDSSIPEVSPVLSAPELTGNEGSEIRALTQEEVDDQSNSFVVPSGTAREFDLAGSGEDNHIASEELPKSRWQR